MQISDIIKQAMKRRKITQEKLSVMLDLSSQSVVSMRINSNNPTVGKLVEVLDALDFELIVRPKRDPEDRFIVTM